MPNYESVFITRPDISSQQVEGLTETLTGIIGEQGGTVVKSEYWGLRNLSYRIKKNRKGHYVLLHLEAPPNAVQEFERNMRINEDVLRYMTIKLDELPEGPTVMMQSRQAREERQRGRRDDRGGRGHSGDRDRGRDRDKDKDKDKGRDGPREGS